MATGTYLLIVEDRIVTTVWADPADFTGPGRLVPYPGKVGEDGVLRASFTVDGRCYLDPDGRYELPVDSQILERFTLFEGEVVDLFDGISDEEVRQQLATTAPEPEASEANQGEMDVWERLAVLEGTVDFLVEVALGGSGEAAADGLA